MAKILIVEDDEMLGLAMLTAMEARKHVVELVGDGDEALSRLKIYKYEIVILDWALPGSSGIEICKSYRERGGAAGILMLTGKNQIQDKELGFQTGVDDYLTKPFDMRELQMRIDALLRRSHSIKDEVVNIANIEMNLRTRTANKDGVELPLSAGEFSLLEFLIRHQGQYFTVTQLLDEVWTSETDSSQLAVRQCISRLRKKFLSAAGTPIIKTSKGLGYRIDL